MTTGRRIWLMAAMLAAAVCASRAARAEFVVVEVTYTHTGQLKDSHFRVQPLPGTPSNWQSPIDYASGEAWVRLEVKTKPAGNTPTRYQVCFELAVNYACTDQAPTYTTPGVYTWGTAFSKFYLGGPVDWSKGIRDTALILKDTNNVKPAPENVGDAVSARYMPTDLRVTVTLVPKGETYVPPASSDAGAADAAADRAEPMSDDAATSPEASVPPDDNPPVIEAGSGTPGTGTPVEPAMPAAKHDAGSTTSLTGPSDMESGCTCSHVRSRSPGGLAVVFGVALLAAVIRMGRRRNPPDATAIEVER
jgi:hypothetical protein